MKENENELSVDDEGISYGLFHRKTKIKGKLFPSKDDLPKASDVRQGYTDLDCYLLAVLSSLAYKSPEKIKACFTEYYDEHGKEKSNAPDFEKARDIKIRLFTEGNKKIIIKVNKTVLRGKGVAWVRLLEKAILVYRAKGYDASVDESLINCTGKIKSRLIDGTKGSSSRNMMLAITGKIPGNCEVADKTAKKFTSYKPQAEEVFTRIKNELDNDKSVVAEAKSTSLFRIYRKGLFFCHLYSVLDAFEKDINGKTYKFIKVRNPYANRIREYNQDRKGKWHSKVRVPKGMDEKGVSDLELNNFVKNFERIRYV